MSVPRKKSPSKPRGRAAGKPKGKAKAKAGPSKAQEPEPTAPAGDGQGAGRSARKPVRSAARATQSAARKSGPTNPDSMPAEVIEFITAIDEYKRKNQRPFPSWSEILEIVLGLGYRKSA